MTEKTYTTNLPGAEEGRAESAGFCRLGFGKPQPEKIRPVGCPEGDDDFIHIEAPINPSGELCGSCRALVAGRCVVFDYRPKPPEMRRCRDCFEGENEVYGHVPWRLLESEDPPGRSSGL